MKVTVEKQQFLRSLYITLGVVERRTAMPMLANVLVEASGESVRVTATDLEIGVKRTFIGSVKSPGTVAVDARKIYEITRELDADEIQLSLEKNGLRVKGGRSRFRLLAADVNEFPSIPIGPPAGKEPKSVVSISSAEMLDVVDKTIFAAAEDDSRVQLSGVYAETPGSGRLRLVATDGHRMAMVERDVDGEGLRPGVILPRKGLAELKRLLEGEDEAVSLAVTGGVARLECGPVELSMRLVEGEFPNYEQVVKKETKQAFTVERDPLVGALRRVAILSNDVARGVRFQLKPGVLTLSAQSSELGEAQEEVEVDYDGEEFGIGFNSRYFLQGVAVMGSAGRIEVSLGDEVSACQVRSSDDSGYAYIIMPLRQ